MRGVWQKGRGVLGAALAVLFSAIAGQNGLGSLTSLLDQQDPLKLKLLGRLLSTTVAHLRPYTGKLALLTALIVLLALARGPLTDLLRSAARTLLGLPEDEPLSFMELTFPADTSKAAFATQQLYALLNTTDEGLSWLERLAVRPKRYSLELVATASEGVRYILAVPQSEALAIHYSLLSYLPGLKIRETTDYLRFPKPIRLRLADLRLTGDMVLPLKPQGDQRQHDPIAFIAGQMAKLEPDELIAYQIVLSPVTPGTHRDLTARRQKLQSRLMAGLPVSPLLKKPSRAPRWVVVLLWLLDHTVGPVARALIGGARGPQAAAPDPASASPLPPYEQALCDQVRAKINDVVFTANIRLLTAAPHRKTAEGRLNAVLTSFRFFATDRQALAPVRRRRRLSRDKLPDTALAKRDLAAPLETPTIVLAAAELADLYHFPDTSQTNAPRFLKSRTAELPMPLSFERAMQSGDALFGVNYHAGQELSIRIPYDQRARHTYVFGRTGTGKTTMLMRAIYEDIVAGHAGVAVLDPHGDMFKHLLGTIPTSRRDKVVIFDPAERDWPVGINLLDPGIKFSDEIEAKDRITSAVIEVFRKLSGEFWGPRMEHILRNATLTALNLPNPSLYTLQRLLTDRDYQEDVAASLRDPVLRQFWQYELSIVGDYQLSSYVSPLTTRLGKFITTGMNRHILLQAKTTISMTDIMDEGKILLVNLSKGLLGEDQSSFFGTVITSLMWMAALARANADAPYRRDFYVYIDEFQNFATRNFSDIVSEGRKFNIALTLAHQSVAQITDQDILRVIAGNAGTIISFAGSPYDEAFLQPFMAPVVSPGDILNLPPHHFYLKAKDIPGADTFTGVTTPMHYFPQSYSPDQASDLLRVSGLTYGTNRAALDDYFTAVFDQIKRAKLDQPPRRKNKKHRRPRKNKRAGVQAVAPAAQSQVSKRAAKTTMKNAGYQLGESAGRTQSAGYEKDAS